MNKIQCPHEFSLKSFEVICQVKYDETNKNRSSFMARSPKNSIFYKLTFKVLHLPFLYEC